MFEEIARTKSCIFALENSHEPVEFRIAAFNRYGSLPINTYGYIIQLNQPTLKKERSFFNKKKKFLLLLVVYLVVQYYSFFFVVFVEHVIVIEQNFQIEIIFIKKISIPARRPRTKH